MKTSQQARLNFFLIAGGFILLIGLLIALFTPEITSWRLSVVDRLLLQAKMSNNDSQRYSILQQAQLIGYHDPQATEALAQYWLSRGELGQAIATYQAGIAEPNYTALGDLALQAQDYAKAKVFFEKEGNTVETTASLVGEAKANYNTGNITTGCAKATQAAKLSLENVSAKAAITSCYILGGSQVENIGNTTQPVMSERQSAYYLINNQVYKPGEAKLLAVKDKSAGDWLVLARLAAARGELQDATQKAEQGIELERSNIELNKELIVLYNLAGNTNKAQEYSVRLQQLQFDKYR